MSELALSIRANGDWRLWHEWASAEEDTFITSLPASALPNGRVAECGDVSAVFVNILGAMSGGGSADNKTVTIQITGWRGNGPGQVLWKGAVTFGAHTFTGSVEGKSSSQAWYSADTYTASVNSVLAEPFGAADNQSVLIVPAIGYRQMYIEAEDKDGSTGTEVGIVAADWAPYSAVISI